VFHRINTQDFDHGLGAVDACTPISNREVRHSDTGLHWTHGIKLCCRCVVVRNVGTFAKVDVTINLWRGFDGQGTDNIERCMTSRVFQHEIDLSEQLVEWLRLGNVTINIFKDGNVVVQPIANFVDVGHNDGVFLRWRRLLLESAANWRRNTVFRGENWLAILEFKTVR
jgi:hypothetical protein